MLAAKDRGWSVIAVCPTGLYVEKIRKLGIRCIEAPLVRGSINPVSELRFLIWFIRFVKAENVDLVHGFTIKNTLHSALVARIGSIKCVGAVAGVGYLFTDRSIRAKILRRLVSYILKYALASEKTILIFQNPSDRDRFVESRILPLGRTRLIPSSGVNTKLFSPYKVHNEHKKVGGGVRVLLAARLIWKKGVGEFVHAARIIREGGSNMSFILAGAPDPETPGSISRSQLTSWCSEGAVKWIGHVDDMPRLYSSVDVFVLPTYYGEGLPRSLIEAGASGLPLITTDIPGCRDVVENDVNGLLVPAKSVSALVEALVYLEENPSIRARMGRASRERISNYFDESIVLDSTMRVYSDLLE